MRAEIIDPTPYAALAGPALCAALDDAIAHHAPAPRVSLSIRLQPAGGRAIVSYDAGITTPTHLLELETDDVRAAALVTWAHARGAGVIIDLVLVQWEGIALAVRAKRAIAVLGAPTRVEIMYGAPTSERGEPAEGYPGVVLGFEGRSVTLLARRTAAEEHAAVAAAYAVEARRLADELAIPVA